MVNIQQILERGRSLGNDALDLVYPPRCLVCDTMGPRVICDPCRGNFKGIPVPYCRICNQAIGTDVSSDLCEECESRSYNFDCVRCGGLFDGTLRDCILNLKYSKKRQLALPLGEFLVEFMQTKPFGELLFDGIVPVPLHKSREFDRGFNQSTEIGKIVAQHTGMTLYNKALARIRNTKAQAGLKGDMRSQNVVDAFKVVDSHSIAGKSLLLLDDVVTTMETANECARVLMDGGAKRVSVLAVARSFV